MPFDERPDYDPRRRGAFVPYPPPSTSLTGKLRVRAVLARARRVRGALNERANRQPLWP